MSEVYIRSQNREKLYRYGGKFSCIEYGENDGRHLIYIGNRLDILNIPGIATMIDDTGTEIAEYESKERCLEVLDEIQRVCAQYLTWSGGAALIRGGMDIQPGAVAIPRVYEMPEK